MVKKRTRQQLRVMLSNTIIALCSSSLPYDGHVSIEGLLGITVDDKETFLVSINQRVQSRSKTESDTSHESDDSDRSSQTASSEAGTRRRRKRKSRPMRLDCHVVGSAEIVSQPDNGLTNNGDHVEDHEAEREPKSCRQEFTKDTGEVEVAAGACIVKEEPVDPSYPEADSQQDTLEQHSSPFTLGQFQELNLQVSSTEHFNRDQCGSLDLSLSNHAIQTDTSGSTQDLYSSAAFPDVVLKQECNPIGPEGPISMERPYQCAICHHTFKTLLTLNVHTRSHTGERPFKCDMCPKSFLTKTHLTEHTRTHTGERPFQCTECDKRFVTKTHLVQHLRIHTGEKPYACHLCGSTFRTSGMLRSHQVTSHNLPNTNVSRRKIIK